MTRPASDILIYDDGCPLCEFQMRVLTWLDWRNVMRLMPLSNPEIRAIAPQLRREDLQEAIHCVTPAGATYRGARAIRYLGLRLPALIPLSLFLWIPGVIYAAERVYMWVSRNRLVLSRLFGCKEACAILPARRRGADLDVPEAGSDV